MRVALGRRYRLCASHRLARPEWSDEQNRQAYGKCANPHGHGHNYVVEVLLEGLVDAVTGMIMDLAAFDALVERVVVQPFDHTNLNVHPAFAARVPTSENFCTELYERLERALPEGLLRQVRVEETVKNSFTYAGGGR